MEKINYRKKLSLVTGKRYEIMLSSHLRVTSVRPKLNIIFGSNGEVKILRFDRRLRENEVPEITWEVVFGGSNVILKNESQGLDLRSTLHGVLYLGQPGSAQAIDLLGLQDHEFEILKLNGVLVSVFPYVYQKSRDVKCDINFVAPVLKVLAERKRCVLRNEVGEFEVDESNVDSSEPLNEIASFDEVEANKENIAKYSKLFGLDPDFIRAIIYMETTHGWYDRLSFRKKSIRPMNVHTEFWKELGTTETKLRNPALNIEFGCKILCRIKNRIKGNSIRKIASVYNFLGSERVTEYGARVEEIFKQRLWLKH